MAQLVLAGYRQCHRRSARDSFALPRSQSIAGRMDLWPLDHGAFESRTLWLDEPPHGGFSLQGLWRRPRAAGAMVQAGSVGMVRRARRGCIFVALWPHQRQAVSRLVRLRAHFLSAGDDCAVAAARRLFRPRMEDRDQNELRRTKCETAWSRAFAGGSLRDVHRVQPKSLSSHQSRHWRPHGRKPA